MFSEIINRKATTFMKYSCQRNWIQIQTNPLGLHCQDGSHSCTLQFPTLTVKKGYSRTDNHFYCDYNRMKRGFSPRLPHAGLVLTMPDHTGYQETQPLLKTTYHLQKIGNTDLVGYGRQMEDGETAMVGISTDLLFRLLHNLVTQ